MKQVIQSARSGELRVLDVPEPLLKTGHALVRTTASLISAGTERMVVDFARKTLVGKAQARPDLVRKVIDKVRRDGIGATLRSVRARLDEPLPLGYSAAGIITAVGPGLEGRFRVGQRVAMAGAGVANHAEYNAVPENLMAAIPDDVSDESAAFATLSAIALHGIRNLQPQIGDLVAVLGTGLVGLLAVRLLCLAGARVVAVDPDMDRLAVARSFGAELTVNPTDAGATETISAWTGGLGVDSVLIAAADDSNMLLVLTADIARDRARISVIGKIGTEFPFAEFMKKELSILVSRSYGPGRYDSEFEEEGVKYPAGFVRWTETANLAECLRLMSARNERRLDIDPLVTHRFPIDRAEAAYQLILERQARHLGVLLTYPSASVLAKPLPVPSRAAADACVVGMIGAGAFARAVLIPTLKAIPGVRLDTVVAARGSSAEHARSTFGFSRAETVVDAMFNDPGINAVVIATAHDSHAPLAERALRAGKAVFVEKPLALDRESLAQVQAARARATGFLTVGFNRRFAPMAVEAQRRLASLAGPKLATFRINAGPPPAKEQPGGRILGELCHFVDLARFLLGAPIVSVHAVAATHGTTTPDDVAVTLAFADQSVTTLAYTGLGDAAESKERIEIFAGGTAITIDDFRRLTIVAGGRKTEVLSRFGQDKGHRAELEAFVAAVRGQGSAPILQEELFETSLATIAVVESLRSGERISL